MALYRLDEGILLEDSEALLPWDSSFSQLRRIGEPTVKNERGRIRLFWSDRLWLGGLSCQITTESDSLGNAADRFRLARVHPASPVGEPPRDCFARVMRHLVAKLGDSTHHDPAAAPYGWPQAEWDLHDVLVFHHIFERFGEMCVTEGWRKPLPRWRRLAQHAYPADDC